MPGGPVNIDGAALSLNASSRRRINLGESARWRSRPPRGRIRPSAPNVPTLLPAQRPSHGTHSPLAAGPRWRHHLRPAAEVAAIIIYLSRTDTNHSLTSSSSWRSPPCAPVSPQPPPSPPPLDPLSLMHGRGSAKRPRDDVQPLESIAWAQEAMHKAKGPLGRRLINMPLSTLLQSRFSYPKIIIRERRNTNTT